MSFIKPVLRAFLLATLLFVLIVFVGLKYHWGKHLNQNNKQIALELPNQEKQNTEQEHPYLTFQPQYNPEIMHKNRNSMPLSTMTKPQIIEHCTKLSEKLFSSNTERYLFMGDCTLSNYHDPIQPLSYLTPANQALMQQRIINCKKKVSSGYGNNYTRGDKLLLLGICVSNKQG